MWVWLQPDHTQNVSVVAPGTPLLKFLDITTALTAQAPKQTPEKNACWQFSIEVLKIYRNSSTKTPWGLI